MSDEEKDKDVPLGRSIDLDAWEALEPPNDFAERVLAKVREEKAEKKPAPKARRWGVISTGIVAAAIAASIFLRVSAPPAQGEAIAQDRTEVAIGGRAKAVLEPGAQVKWNGDDVEQKTGDVFYRVEPGAKFRVHTPAGDVEVKGTCFVVKVKEMQKRDVKSGAIGAALSALAFVAVYEGKVAVSHASEKADLTAGESAQLGSGGVLKSAQLEAGQKAFDDNVAAAEPIATANENLVAQVGEYKKRLEMIAAQKVELEDKLKTTEQRLAATQDGAAPRTRHEYDLDKDDWAQLAREGGVKYRMPCTRADRWTLSPEHMNKLGLAPQDSAPIKEAFERSYQRVWSQIRPLCIQALGVNPEIVDKIGVGTCPHLIYDISAATDGSATKDAHTAAAEIRAGLRPMPGPNDKVHPVTQMFLYLTDTNKSFEADLAKSFGPEEAHRLAFADLGCGGTSHWGGGRTAEDKPKK